MRVQVSRSVILAAAGDDVLISGYHPPRLSRTHLSVARARRSWRPHLHDAVSIHSSRPRRRDGPSRYYAMLLLTSFSSINFERTLCRTVFWLFCDFSSSVSHGGKVSRSTDPNVNLCLSLNVSKWISLSRRDDADAGDAPSWVSRKIHNFVIVSERINTARRNQCQ